MNQLGAEKTEKVESIHASKEKKRKKKERASRKDDPREGVESELTMERTLCHRN
jgi:hypothetical protein